MEFLNQTYEAVDNQPRPVSYINPCAIRPSSIDEENYETLTEVQTQLNNIYEPLPIAEGDTLQHTAKESCNQLKVKKDNTCDLDGKEIMQIKQDLRKTKVYVLVLALFVGAFLVISLIAVALAVIIPQRASTDNPTEPNGPQAIIAPGNSGLDESTRQMITDLSSELQKLRDTANATITGLIDDHSKLVEQVHRNFSEIVSQLSTLTRAFTSHSDQLSQLIQQITNRSNATSLVNQVTSLQDQSRQMNGKIMQAEDHISDLMLIQENLQQNLNATQNNFTHVYQQIGVVQNQLSTNQREVQTVDARVTAVQNQLTTIQADVTSLNGQVNTVTRQLTTTQDNIESVRNQASSLQTSLNNHLSSPVELYRNCRRDTTSCSVSNLVNNNRRLLCSTPSLNANVTGFYTLDMRCEYSGATELEAPSLQRTTSTTYFCQCSLVIPSSTGRFTSLSTPPTPGICTLVVTRCPLSQTVI